MSAIILSLILVGLVFTLSTSGFYTRFDVLGRENKRIALGLAESCANVALLRVGQNYAYDPTTDPGFIAGKGVPINVGSQKCYIQAFNNKVVGPSNTTFTIVAQANYLGTFSNVQVGATVQNPTVAPAPVIPPTPSCADTVMMIDRTGSISSSDLTGEKAAAVGLVNLYNQMSGPPLNLPASQLPLIGFGAFGTNFLNPAAQIITHLTNNYPGLISSINAMPTAFSYTSIQSAISVAQSELSSLSDGKQKVLILISDGGANRSVADPLCTNPSNDPSVAALCAADQAKLAYTHIFTVHYGDPSGRNYLATLASGIVSNSPHQPGSKNDDNPDTPAGVTAENNDNDYFFISPTAGQLTTLFNQIGSIVCPAASGGGNISLPPSDINLGSWQENP